MPTEQRDTWKSVVRGLRFCAAAIAFHGIFLLLADAAQSLFPGVFSDNNFDIIGKVVFWGLAVPALLLARPFTPVFWKLGLMNAPGWFVWPKPLGIALAYAVWVVFLLLLAQGVQRWRLRK